MKRSRLITLILIMTLVATAISCLAACGEGGSILVELYDGENCVKKVSVTPDTAYELGTISKVGHEFLGWYSAIDGGSALTDASGSSAGGLWSSEYSPMVYAHFSLKKYNLRLDKTDAIFEGLDTYEVTYGADVPATLPVPEKNGFSFKGWFTAKENGKQVTDDKGTSVSTMLPFNADNYNIDENTTEVCLYPQWTKRKITYSFVTQGTPVDDVIYSIDDTIDSLPTSTLDKHCFRGWFFDLEGTIKVEYPYDIPDNAESTVTLYARFDEGSVDILEFTVVPGSHDKEYEVSYTGNASTIIVPDTYFDKKVTRINRFNSAELREVVLPSSVNELADGAFENCQQLETIELPQNIKNIGKNTFKGCTSLKNINIPLAVETIGADAFAGCNAITTINIGKNVKTIGNGAFSSMDKLESVTADEANAKFEAVDGVLYGKIGNTLQLIVYPANKAGDTYVIDERANRILASAFRGSKLITIDIGGKIAAIGESAFEDSKLLTRVAVSSESRTMTIGNRAFAGCSNLRGINIDMTIIPTLGQEVFVGTARVFAIYVSTDQVKRYKTTTNWREFSERIYSKSMIYGDFVVEDYNGGYAIKQYVGENKIVNVPDIINTKTIMKISDNAFSFSEVEEVVLPSHVDAIGNKSFINCAHLKSIVLTGVPPTLGSMAFDNVSVDFAIYVKSTIDVLEQYKTAPGWSAYADNIWSYQTNGGNN